MHDTGCLGLVHWDYPEGWDGEGAGDDLGEWHLNMYTIICGMGRQSRFNAGHRMLGAGALG